MRQNKISDIGTNIIQLNRPGNHTLTIKNTGQADVMWFGLQAYEYSKGYRMLGK